MSDMFDRARKQHVRHLYSRSNFYSFGAQSTVLGKRNIYWLRGTSSGYSYVRIVLSQLGKRGLLRFHSLSM